MTNDASGPFLARCRELIAANVERLRGYAGITPEIANRRPADGGWSAAQCIDHAVLTVELYLPFMDEALARSRPLATGEVKGRGTLVGRVLLDALDPDRKKPRRIRAPGIFAPSQEPIDWPALLDRAQTAHDRLLEILERGADRDLDRARHRTPLSWLLRVSLAQALQVHAIHVARHLDQADRVLAASGRAPAEPATATA